MKNTSLIGMCLLILLLSLPRDTFAQTKKIKRPSSRVGISSVDNFVRESFDIYDKVYMYDGYAEAKRPLDDSDIDVLENALDDLTILSDNAPNIIADLGGESVLKQGKATLQINRAKKALKYSIKTSKELLAGRKNGGSSESETDDNEEEDVTTNDGGNQSNNSSGSPTNDGLHSDPSLDLEVISKFDFVPGDKILFFDDFEQDFVGDFPSKWNTNGSGEVVTFNNVEGKWFELKPGYRVQFIPILETKLPENYTIEFDVLANGLDKQTSSNAKLVVNIEDNETFSVGKNYCLAEIPFAQYMPIGIKIRNSINGKAVIGSTVDADIRDETKNIPHISIAVNKNRYRLWVDQVKYIDVPRFVPDGAILSDLKFSLKAFKDGKERVFIRNLKVAEGGVDLRRKLMSEGKISTNGILFDSGSANLKTQSYGIIRQISQVLMQDDNISLNIVGHTDSDGPDDANLKLSKARAQAVKDALIKVYKIDGGRLTTDGKGESEPVAENNSADGKAQNRRVVFEKT